MKKQCCFCNSTITQNKLCSNHNDVTFCMSKLSPKSVVGTQRDFSDKQDSSRRKKTNSKGEQTKKNLINIKMLILILC